MQKKDNSTHCIPENRRVRTMLQIKTTDDFTHGRGECLDCGYSCQTNESDPIGGLEAAINHAITEDHRMIWIVRRVTEMKLFCTREEDTVDLGPKERCDESDL